MGYIQLIKYGSYAFICRLCSLTIHFHVGFNVQNSRVENALTNGGTGTSLWKMSSEPTLPFQSESSLLYRTEEVEIVAKPSWVCHLVIFLPTLQYCYDEIFVSFFFPFHVNGTFPLYFRFNVLSVRFLRIIASKNSR